MDVSVETWSRPGSSAGSTAVRAKSQPTLAGIGIRRALKMCEKDNPSEEKLAALQNAIKAVAASPTDSWFRERMQRSLTKELIPAAAAEQCRKVATVEAENLPTAGEGERIARLRFPRNRSERLLRGGASLEEVATQAALQVLQKWADILRPFASLDELPYVISSLVHEQPLTQVRIFGPTGPSSPRMMPQSHLTPPAAEPLGAALRRVAPLPSDIAAGQPWEFLNALCEALRTMEEVDTSWPDTAERRHMRLTSTLEVNESACDMAKERQQQETGAPSRRAPLSVSKQVRTTADFAWATYQADKGTRATDMGSFSPQVFSATQKDLDVPGPGMYPKPPTRCRERAHYPVVGRRRVANGEATLAQVGRFFFPRGDPLNMFQASEREY